MIDAGFIRGAAREADLGEPAVILAPLAGTPGPAVRFNDYIEHYPASMIKVPIAAALAIAHQRGTVRLDDAVRVAAKHVTVNDAPSPFVSGYETTAAAAAHAMLCASDNVATNVLIDVLGRDWIGAACRDAFGLERTVVRRMLSGALPLIDDPEATGRNAHPAADAARLFAAIDRERTGRFDFIYRALDEQIWNDKIPAGLRRGDRFAHKTGDTDDASHDGGLLTLVDGRRFVFVVYTTLATSPGADARIATFARIVRAALDESR